VCVVVLVVRLMFEKTENEMCGTVGKGLRGGK
jgi:hypothetical protein